MITLSRSYPSREGAPVLDRVDPAIFTLRYFAACMACGFCHDACCFYGVDVSADEHARILTHAAAIEARTGIPRGEWFTPGWTEDAEFPGGRHTRTRVKDGACVFLDRRNRGCHLHALALDDDSDYHALKPLVSALFPLTFDKGALLPSAEVRAGQLVCGGAGPTLFSAVEGELAWYFGDALVHELRAIFRSLDLHGAGGAPPPPQRPPHGAGIQPAGGTSSDPRPSPRRGGRVPEGRVRGPHDHVDAAVVDAASEAPARDPS